MAAAQTVGVDEASPEQVSVEQARAVVTRERRERFRERIAQHLAGPSAPSNYEAMVDFMQRDPNAAPDCEVCGGEGKRRLSRHLRAQIEQRLENQQTELEHLERLHAGYLTDARRPRKAGDDLEERLRQEAVGDADRTQHKIIQLQESMRDAKEELEKRGSCRDCAGTGKGPRPRDLDPGRPDSMFSTVMCPACRGLDARQHPSLLHRHHGTSAGSVNMRGPLKVEIIEDGTPEGAQVVIRSHPRDDEAAEREDICERCFGVAYVVPIDVRPSLRTNNLIEEPEGITDLPEHWTEHDFEPPPPDDLTDPEGFLESARKDDPLLAAAVAAYLGLQGDGYSDHAWGRRFALFPLTEPGRQLAGAAGSDFDAALVACEEQRLAETQAATSNPRRRALISLADTAARALERRVEAALRSVEPG